MRTLESIRKSNEQPGEAGVITKRRKVPGQTVDRATVAKYCPQSPYAVSIADLRRINILAADRIPTKTEF